jgi:two-component system response regulator HydG
VTALRDTIARETGLDQIVAVSPAMRGILATIGAVACTDATVLIEGESGTGKELMARLIHQRSDRTARPFLVINCGAMPENLLESELYGHLRGAFTGAHKDHKGLFEAADGGTLFLDEISEVSPGFQVKLLRTLQEHTIRRVGDTKEMPVNVRVIAATNQDLNQLVRDGRFRQDLFFRIKVIPIHLPPLRKRREDILPLAESFLTRLADRMGRRTPRLNESAKQKLVEHDWPGNVRELENTLERALIFRHVDEIDARDLSVETCIPTREYLEDEADGPMLPLHEVERRHILEVLDRCGGNKARAAEILGIGYNTLWRKLKKYG